MRTGRPATLLLAVVLAACGGEGASDDGSPAAAPTATLAVGPVDATATADIAASPSPTSTTRAEAKLLRPVRYAAWRESGQTVAVHFVARVRNTGDVPVEVTRIEYELLDRANAAFDFGSVPRAYPPVLAPGEEGVIGGTAGRVSYSDPKEITGVSVFIDTRAAESTPPALEVRDLALAPAGRADQFRLTGEVLNRGDTAADRVLLGVALVDAEGDWIGFVGGSVGVAPLAPSASAPFSLSAALPPGIDAEVASFAAFAAGALVGTGGEDGASGTPTPPASEAPGLFQGDFTVAVGKTVVWTNFDEQPHNVVARDGSWRTGVIDPGDRDSVTFNEAGTWEFYCTIHPELTGTLRVEPAAD